MVESEPRERPTTRPGGGRRGPGTRLRGRTVSTTGAHQVGPLASVPYASIRGRWVRAVRGWGRRQDLPKYLPEYRNVPMGESKVLVPRPKFRTGQ